MITWTRRLDDFMSVWASSGLATALHAARRRALPAVVAFTMAGGAVNGQVARAPGIAIDFRHLDLRALEPMAQLLSIGAWAELQGETVRIGLMDLMFAIPTQAVLSGLGMLVERFVVDEFAALNVRDALVLDVGANIGDSAIYFVARGAFRVMSFEPIPATAEVARMNVRLNHLDDQIEVKSVGIGAASALRSIVFDPAAPHLASVIAEPGRAVELPVEIVSFAEAIRSGRTAAQHRRLVAKIDCEGCEADVFAQTETELREVDEMLVEAHSLRSRDIVASTLERNGFDVRHISAAAGIHTVSLIHAVRRKDALPDR